MEVYETVLPEVCKSSKNNRDNSNMDDAKTAIPVMMYVVFTCILVTLIYRYIMTKNHEKDRRKPPLVPGVPFLGNLFNIDRKSPHLSLTSLAETHGDIYRIKILGREIVVVNSLSAISQVLYAKDSVFAGRPSFFRITYGFHNVKDLIFGNYDEKWTHMKKVAHQTLKQFAMGHQHVEDIVTEETLALLRNIERTNGDDFDPALDTLTSVVNAISGAVMGHRLSHTDPEMIHFKKTTRLFSQACSVTEGVELDLFPWLRFLPNESFRKLTEARSMLDQFIDKQLALRKKAYCPSKLTCVLDALFKANEESRNQDPGEPGISQVDVRAIFIDIFVSGTFTTAVTMNAFLLLMAHHGDVQRRIQHEIEQKIGTKQLPVGADRSECDLLEAAILETLRLISHVPLCLPHMTLDDTTIDNYHVDKNTEIFINLWRLHHDDCLWEEPWCFRPDRFLDDAGKLLSRTHPVRKRLIPFGGGRRMCIGENLARERIFIYLGAILQRFNILPPKSRPLLSRDPRDFQLGLILEPAPFLIRAQKRHAEE